MATTTLTPAAPAYRSGLYEWLTTTDHKKIGIMYLVNSMVFFLAGGILALVVRVELAVPGLQFMDEAFYNQAFTMHASFMLFLFVIPILAGFGNYVVPLQLGAPDMAFPRINALSFWLRHAGRILMASLPGLRRVPPRRLDRVPAAVGRGRTAAPGTDLWIMGLT
jgi:cytochrome c oxidase subunit 1